MSAKVEQGGVGEQEILGPKKYLADHKRQASIRGQAEARGREGHTEEKRMKDMKGSLALSQKKESTYQKTSLTTKLLQTLK